ncbi:MAG: hypothetical protein AMS25_06960 [Gemmatimonas sp. SM23_52]|nr:MAG: hypothetical protein AMS25_06960 [Gemmatimonas sp. SM23_52]
MPSDLKTEVALRALAGPIERYRSAVVTTVEEVRGYLQTHESKQGAGLSGVAAGLGQFAAGLVDFERFARVTADGASEDVGALQKVEKAFDILRVLAAGEDDLFYVKVKPGGRLRDAVAGRLAEMGRGFAAARVAGMATTGRLGSGNESGLLDPLGFERWNEGERRVAPPLLVEVDGADLHAGDLAEFLDGAVKIVLVVTGETAPAPLVRLITPSTFVLQTAGEQGLDRFSEFAGPGVAALVPEGAAEFIHDPTRGQHPWERIELLRIPEKGARHRVGGMSISQQKEELEQLLDLAEAPGAEAAVAGGAAGEGGAPAGTVASQVDKLAAWLLSQADLSNTG